jgi:MFS family permease
MDLDTNQLPEKFLKTKRYALFWLASLFSNIGTWMQQVAQPWVVLSLSNSPFWVGLDSFALNAPGLLFMILGGVLADRYDKRKTVLFFQAIQFLCVIVMVILLMAGLLKVWMIVLISFLVGVTDSLSMPSFQSIIPSLVDQEDIHHAVSLNSTQFNLSRILGPALAGIVIVRFGAVTCFSANAASYIPFFLSLYFIYPHGWIKMQKSRTQLQPVQHLYEFKKLLFSQDVRLPLVTTLVTNVFCTPLITFCAVLIKNIFHGQIGGFGGAMTAIGIGGLIGAGTSFISLPKSLKRNRVASLMAIFLGLLIVAIALNHSLILLMVLLVCAGAALTTSNISVNTFLQENATNAVRGRIAGFYQLAMSGGISIGALFTGFTVSQLDISTALMINGTLAVVFQVWLLRLQLRAS